MKECCQQNNRPSKMRKTINFIVLAVVAVIILFAAYQSIKF
jgi:flagellar basal body-associated protein FliL